MQRAESVQAPIKKGREQVGTATLSYADEVIATIPLVASESVERSPVITILPRESLFFTAPWFLIVMAVILVLVVVYIILMLLYPEKQKTVEEGSNVFGICKWHRKRAAFSALM